MRKLSLKLSPKHDPFRFAPNQWLWCLHCMRFFQGRDARPDFVGGVQGCAFDGCTGAGYQVDIHDWDTWGEPGNGWPAKADLRKGLVADWRVEPPSRVLERAATLNRDCRRRDEILGIATGDDPDGLTRFVDLDLVRLARLLQERFIHPDEHQNAAPRVCECVDFMSRWPEVRAHGYALHPARADYRVSIEGFSCSLADVPSARRAALRAAFECVTCDADERSDEHGRLRAWWD